MTQAHNAKSRTLRGPALRWEVLRRSEVSSHGLRHRGGQAPQPVLDGRSEHVGRASTDHVADVGGLLGEDGTVLGGHVEEDASTTLDTRHAGGEVGGEPLVGQVGENGGRGVGHGLIVAHSLDRRKPFVERSAGSDSVRKL